MNFALLRNRPEFLDRGKMQRGRFFNLRAANSMIFFGN
jgi:hypothetical protein